MYLLRTDRTQPEIPRMITCIFLRATTNFTNCLVTICGYHLFLFVVFPSLLQFG
ncbi:4581_t:CDS:2 [Dentiscutata heterogama]|uniref:4581_t:CDS:1 n=1 Tax=Dentiscutata heterogama TaxID=1316150 RepID=A0ACA9KPQ0_9GLOM|nr:4581_t:CDS:2 [Dentiscutata heterogama]